MLSKELDKLRNKELTFGCILDYKDEWGHINTTMVVRNGTDDFISIEGIHGDQLYDDFNYEDIVQIIGHPLTYGRFIYMITQYGYSLDLPYKIQLVFMDHVEAYDQNEIQRMQNKELWNKLFPLLKEFSTYF